MKAHHIIDEISFHQIQKNTGRKPVFKVLNIFNGKGI